MIKSCIRDRILLSSGNIEAAKLLIDAGADVNSKNCENSVPLKLAAVAGHVGMVKYLASHPNIKLHEQVIIIVSVIVF